MAEEDGAESPRPVGKWAGAHIRAFSGQLCYVTIPHGDHWLMQEAVILSYNLNAAS